MKLVIVFDGWLQVCFLCGATITSSLKKITAKVLLLRSSVPGYFKVSPWFTRTVAAVVSYVVGGDDDDA